MADIELVIKIPEEKYNEYKRIGDSRDILFEAIRNGTPLDEVLDKIRLEIEKAVDDVIEIIDKYREVNE